eukprot:scaffold6.g2698.t1
MPRGEGSGAVACQLLAKLVHPPPPPLPCKPVAEAPPPHLFVTWEGLLRHSYLAQGNGQQAAARGGLGAAPAPAHGAAAAAAGGESDAGQEAWDQDNHFPEFWDGQEEPDSMEQAGRAAVGSADGVGSEGPAGEGGGVAEAAPTDRKRKRKEGGAEAKREGKKERKERKEGKKEKRESKRASKRREQEQQEQAAAAEGEQAAEHTAPPSTRRRVARLAAATAEAAAPAAAKAPPATSPRRRSARARGGAAAARQAPPASGSEQEGGDASDGEEPAPAPPPDAVLAKALAAVGADSWEAFAAAHLMEVRASFKVAAEQGKIARARPPTAVRLQDVLNSKSRVYHKKFEQAFNDARNAVRKGDKERAAQVQGQRKEGLRQHTHLLPPLESKLSAADHAWYLAREGRPLLPHDQERMVRLRLQAAKEQREWDAAADAAVAARAERYTHCTSRQAAQLEQDMAQRRAHQALALPRYYRLQAAAPLPPLEAALPAEAARLRHVALRGAAGVPPRAAPPPVRAALDARKLYLPAAVDLPPAEAVQAAQAAGQRSGQRSGGGAPAAPGVYLKARPPPVECDPTMLCLAAQLEREQQEQGQGATDGGSGGGAVFCLAASALAAVAGTVLRQYATSWEVPVRITEGGGSAEEGGHSAEPGPERGGASGGGGKRVFLGKPLLPRTATMRQRQHRLQKYAWLSAAVQHAEQQAEQVEQAEQQAALDGTSAAPGRAGAVAAAAAAVGLAPRETTYNEWRVGPRRLLVRAHGRLLAPPLAGAPDEGGEGGAAAGADGGGEGAASAGGGGAVPAGREQEPVVLLLKEEYLPDPDREEFTREQATSGLFSLLLRPQAAALLAVSVDVPQGRVLDSERLTREELARRLGPTAAQDDQVAIFRALPASIELGEDRVPPLPMVESEERQRAGGASQVYDLHAAHAASSAIVPPDARAFVRPRWRPFSADVPQIPRTFPPKLTYEQMGVTRHLFSKSKKKQRQAKAKAGHAPVAWEVKGQFGDFDQVEGVGPFSQEAYARGLDEELE